MRTHTAPKERRRWARQPSPSWVGGILASASHPGWVAAVVAGTGLVMGWQFITDAARSVPAFDAAWYQWRAEFLLANEPAGLILLRGANEALAGGYRVAEPVLAGLMRTVGGVAAGTPTVFLSVMFRVLAGAGVAVFAWQHRRDALLLYLTLLVATPVFLLQRFFGFLDNFMTLALVAAVLVLLRPMRTSWVARVAAVDLMFLGGLAHPTTLALFLLSMGAVAAFRVFRERSLRPALDSEGPVLLAGAAAVGLMAAAWTLGMWGPPAGLAEAAVPPPQPVSYFVQRTISVMSNLTPIVLVPLLGLGLGHLGRSVWRRKEWFAEVTVGWTLPLVGMLGFLAGAAYPYFRFFNSTLAPILLVAVGLAVVLRAPRLLPARTGRPVAVAVTVGVVLLLALWWIRGVGMWNSTGSWLTPEVREAMAGARAYLDTEPEGGRAVFVVDAQPDPEIVPYGEYKEYVNSIYAGLDGDQIERSVVFFGRVEDLEAGRATRLGDEQYDAISADTVGPAVRALEEHPGDVVLLVPVVFNQFSTNQAFVRGCAPPRCVPLGDSGVYVLPELGGTPLSDQAWAAASQASSAARRFEANPPGPLAGLGGTLLSFLRLALLLAIPGWLLFRVLPGVSWIEGVALVPILSVGSVTAAGILLLAVVRDPLTPVLGWAAWAIAVAVGLTAALTARVRSS